MDYNNMQNSWYLKQNEQHHFFCKCGTHDIIINHIEDDYSLDMVKFKREEIDFAKIPNLYYPNNCCSMCGNEHYLDVNALLFENITRYWSNIQWAYEYKKNVHGWDVSSFLIIPEFNEKRDDFVFNKIELSTYKLTRNGNLSYTKHCEHFFKKMMKVDENYQRIDRLIKSQMVEELLSLVTKNPIDSLLWLQGKTSTIEEVCFFLKYKNIQFKDAFLWKNKIYFVDALNNYSNLFSFLDYFLNHRKQKSLRKAQFDMYEKMMNLGGYNPTADYIFSKTISDRNHLLKALRMEVSLKQVIFNDCNIENIYHFIDFLKNHYEEKHIVRLWLSIEHDDLTHYLLRDSSNLFFTEEMRVELNEKFVKTALNIRAIHHELTKHSRKLMRIKREQKIFTYSDATLDMQVELEGLSYRLPMNNDDLYEWGALLHNCLFSYVQSVAMGVSVIFGVFVGKQLTYALEVRNGRIAQVSAIFNKKLMTEEREKIDRWYKDIYIPRSIKNFSNY